MNVSFGPRSNRTTSPYASAHDRRKANGSSANRWLVPNRGTPFGPGGYVDMEAS
jgi:hypothetical protein